MLHEVNLSEPIRYAPNDPVEAWLHQLLCLDAGNILRVSSGCPPPDECQLYPNLIRIPLNILLINSLTLCLFFNH